MMSGANDPEDLLNENPSLVALGKNSKNNWGQLRGRNFGQDVGQDFGQDFGRVFGQDSGGK